MSALFACSRCFTRHPFEELSVGQQLCKECRGSYIKCTYCRSEFQHHIKGLLSGVCRKCEANVKSFGKPSACEYCNIIAAFIGSKCQRCTYTEKKYGPPVTCEQCKQKCAFDRKDDDKKVDGKLLCWLCTLSYKRALAKTKKAEATRRTHSKHIHHATEKSREIARPRSFNKRPQRVDVTKVTYVPPSHNNASVSAPPAKIARTNSNTGANNKKAAADPNSSDHLVAMTQLREQIVLLQKQITIKDTTLLTKEKYITELKAKHFTVENDLRNKMKKIEKEHESRLELMVNRMKALQKEVATLSKSGRKSFGNRDSGSSGSRTNSPLIA